MYTTDFFQLFVRIEVTVYQLQLVSHYIGRLRLPLQDVLNMFDLVTILEAHQRALQAEKQLAQWTPGTFRQGTTTSQSALKHVPHAHLLIRPSPGAVWLDWVKDVPLVVCDAMLVVNWVIDKSNDLILWNFVTFSPKRLLNLSLWS